MGAPGSFTARRPNASNLPNFELPPPPLSGLQQKYQQYPGVNPTPATTLTSVGNLLTPPSNGSTDGVSPSSSALNTGSSQPGIQPFTPGTSMFAQQAGNSVYGFHPSNAAQPHFGQGRSLFSPSLNSLARGNSSPTAGENLPPPPYELPQYHSSSVPMSAGSLPAMAQHQSQMVGSGMMHVQTPVSASSVTQASPVNGQEAFARPPPTPTYYGHQSAPSSAAPQQGHFSYSTGPSPVQHSPHSAGGAVKLSPVHGPGPVPSLHAYPQPYSRPYSHPLPGPVLSNINNPHGHLQMVGLHHGMLPGGFNSGHAAHLQHMYGPPHAAQPSPPNDRPFRCDQCPQSFNRNHDLKRHKRIHLAVKPFPCGHCDKSFSRKDALKVRPDPPPPSPPFPLLFRRARADDTAQRHVLVKGCGKAHATAEVKEIDGSVSPTTKSESVDTSPTIPPSA